MNRATGSTALLRESPCVNRSSISVFSSSISRDGLNCCGGGRDRAGDVRGVRLRQKSGRFPVILIPLGLANRRDSVVLRPIQSVDGMTADSVAMPDELLHAMAARIMAIPEIAGVYYDLTHKPPGTIEWE